MEANVCCCECLSAKTPELLYRAKAIRGGAQKTKADWGSQLQGRTVSKEALPGKGRERATYFRKHLASPFSRDILKGYQGLQKEVRTKCWLQLL